MASNIASILDRLGFKVAPVPAPEPVALTPTCAPWCVGAGIRRLPSPHRSLTDAPPSYVEMMRSVRYDYCSCPAGAAARARHEEALAALEVAAIQRQADRVLDAAELPAKLRRYGLDAYTCLGSMIDKGHRWQVCSHRGANLLLWGDIGTYKTSFGAALLREHLAQGGSGLFLPVGDFLGRIRASYGSDASSDERAASEWTLVRDATAPGLLLLDDVPADLSDWARGILFRMLNARDLHERATILTTNLNLTQIEAALGKRTFDRFRGSASDPETGESFVYRFAGASQRGLRAARPADQQA